jgi:hypothetical protein
MGMVMADAPKKYYGTFDATGRATGFWVDDIFPPQENGDRNAKIPAAAVELTEQQWLMLVNNPNARFIDGEVVTTVPPVPMPSSQYNWGPTLVEVVGTET